MKPLFFRVIFLLIVLIMGVFLSQTAFNLGYYLGQISVANVAEKALLQCVNTLGGKCDFRTRNRD